MSTAGQYSFLGHTLSFVGWQGKEGTRALNLWVANPQADASANRRALTAGVQELLKLNVIQVTVDGRNFVNA